MKVSIIVPNFNHLKFLPQRLESIFNQTFQDFEVILLDDCSTDGSWEYLETFKNHPKVTQSFRNEKNSGSPFRQWEKGISLAKFDWIWIAESDDHAEPELLGKLVALVEKNNNVGIAYGNTNWINEKGEIGKSLIVNNESFFKIGNDEIIRLLKWNSIQNASAVLMRSDLVKAYMHKMDGYKSCGDWVLYLNILQDSNVCYTHEILSNFRWYHSNTSNNAIKKDLWTSEGTKILSYLEHRKIKLSNNQLNKIYYFWIKRIIQSSNLNLVSKVISLININKFYFKFLRF